MFKGYKKLYTKFQNLAQTEKFDKNRNSTSQKR